MNKLIKKLVESLFDDIDDIVDTPERTVSQELYNNEIRQLKKLPYNITEYPDSFVNFDRAENLYNIGLIYINEACKNKYYIRYFNNVKKFQINCKFKDYDNSIDIDTIEIYGFGRTNKYDLNCILHVNDKVITDIIFNMGQPHYNMEFIPYDYIGNELFLQMFYLINTYIENGYKIKNIILNAEDDIYHKTKNIIIGDARKEVIDPNKVIPIKEEYINLYSKINIFVTNNNETPIKLTKLCKNVILGYSLICENLKTFELFLLYLKKIGFKLFKMEQQPLIMNPSEYNGFKYGEDLFKQFLIDYNIPNYKFSNKKDMHEIINIIGNKVISHLQENNKLNAKSLSDYSSNYMTSNKVIEKGKDEKGNFIIIQYKLDYDDDKVKDHVYSKTDWKVYQSGLIDLVDEDLYWSKMDK